MLSERFKNEGLSEEELAELNDLSRQCKGDIIKMTALAGCGHPGGSISSLDIFLVLYRYASVDPSNPWAPERDRIVVSHGHVSPGVYSVLGRRGFFPLEAAISGFRKMGTPFEGHVTREVPGVEWSTGNLGQGLSAGCGFAVAGRLNAYNYHTFVAMSDGEQAKGQVAEARRFACKYGLDNLTVIIDFNHIQISGPLEEVMPQNIKENWRADGWRVLEIDGHDHQQIYRALRQGVTGGEPTVILAETVMGKGVSFMENKWQYHGKALNQEEYQRALSELDLSDDLEDYRRLRNGWSFAIPRPVFEYPVKIATGSPVLYEREAKSDNRGAFGKALKGIAEDSCGVPGNTPLAVLDCDLASSVKTEDFARCSPKSFFQTGVQEHNAITVAGALSSAGVVTLFAGFGVFGVDETYNQSRLNDLNHTNLKLVLTHCGLDVGEDGKTHQCIDYLGLTANLFGFKTIVPADPNQTDRVIRYILGEHGNFVVTMGRSKVPVILGEDGKPFFGKDYRFVYGRGDWLRRGDDITVVTMGAPMSSYAVQVSDRLRAEEGIKTGVLLLASPLAPDMEALKKAAATGRIITMEDHHVGTGLGCRVAAALVEQGVPVKIKRLGVTRYGESGTSEELYRREGMDVDGLLAAVRKMVNG